MRSLAWLQIIILIAIGGCQSNSESSGTTTVTGVVKTVSGEAIPAATVNTYIDSQGKTRIHFGQTQTDSQGRFSIPDMTADQSITIVATKVFPGQMLFNHEKTVVVSDNETMDVGIISGGLMPPPIATPETPHIPTD